MLMFTGNTRHTSASCLKTHGADVVAVFRAAWPLTAACTETLTDMEVSTALTRFWSVEDWAVVLPALLLVWKMKQAGRVNAHLNVNENNGVDLHSVMCSPLWAALNHVTDKKHD